MKKMTDEMAYEIFVAYGPFCDEMPLDAQMEMAVELDSRVAYQLEQQCTARTEARKKRLRATRVP